MAPRILAGDHKAYTEALIEFSPLTELSDLGSSIYFTVHHAKLLECVLKVNGRQVIPAEVKSLTASGKLSVKAMPKARFHEICQDYVCGCVLRMAREVFALLPVETVLVTASVDAVDPRTGLPALHRDPFDRMLICQALARGWHIASSDSMFQQYPVKLL